MILTHLVLISFFFFSFFFVFSEHKEEKGFSPSCSKESKGRTQFHDSLNYDIDICFFFFFCAHDHKTE